MHYLPLFYHDMTHNIFRNS